MRDCFGISEKTTAGNSRTPAESRSRSELTAAFLSVLELYRSEQIGLRDTEKGVEVTKFEGVPEQGAPVSEEA